MGRIELRECPFCGCKETERHTTQKYDSECDAQGYESTISCAECCGRLSAWAFKQDAAEDGITAAWNTRAYDTIITAQQGEIERLEKDYDRINDFENSQCVKLLAKLNAVERERDAAVTDIEELIEMYSRGWACEFCVKYNGTDSGCDTTPCKAKWRGLPGKGEA